MLKRLQIIGCAVLLAVLAQSASAFSLLGPKVIWETADLGYSIDFSESPQNLGEGYRWNVPVLYYAYDQTYLDYFGSNGVRQADLGVGMLNSVLGRKVSTYSADLSEFAQESSQINYTAAALHLFDIRSCVFELIFDRIGLANPQAYTWTLRARVATPSCPDYVYTVIKRNFDPVTFEPSVYVNGVLYTYWIAEFCPTVNEAITVPTPVDPSAETDTTVAEGRIAYADETFYGRFYTGITRDDAGGLRYLYNTNNVNLEDAGPVGTTTYQTNNSASQLLYTSNLLAMAQVALTNNDAALQALYPNASFSAANSFIWTNVYTTNITAYFTNSPLSVYGTTNTIVEYTTNVTVAVQQQFTHNFANLFVPEFTNNAWELFPVTDITTLTRPSFAEYQKVTVSDGGPYSVFDATNAVPTTNVTTRLFVTNQIAGEFFFLPTNLCSVQILANQLMLTNSFTNTIYSATNSLTNSVGTGGTTNSTTSTNISFTSLNLITFSTNHVFVVYPVTCPTNVVSARQGMDSVIQLVRQDYDSLINRFWTPVTNTWTGVTITNNQRSTQTMTRVLTAPDILLAAADLGMVIPPYVNFSVERGVPVWDTNGISANLTYAVNGPGTIQPGTLTTLTFNKIGQVNYNVGPFYMDEATSSTDFLWGSFDGTTNAPIIYPDSAGVATYQDQLVIQAYPAALPEGVFGIPFTFSYVNSSSGVAVSYLNQFSGSGGQPPYVFGVTPGTSLPPGLALGSDGTVSGAPAAEGLFSFSIRLTDAGGRSIDTPYSVLVNAP